MIYKALDTQRRELIEKLRATNDPVEQDRLKLVIDELEEKMSQANVTGKVSRAETNRTMKDNAKKERYPDYERVKMDEVITFGTSVYIRKDKQAIKIVFPAGQSLDFMPIREVKWHKDKLL